MSLRPGQVRCKGEKAMPGLPHSPLLADADASAASTRKRAVGTAGISRSTAKASAGPWGSSGSSPASAASMDGQPAPPPPSRHGGPPGPAIPPRHPVRYRHLVMYNPPRRAPAAGPPLVPGPTPTVQTPHVIKGSSDNWTLGRPLDQGGLSGSPPGGGDVPLGSTAAGARAPGSRTQSTGRSTGGGGGGVTTPARAGPAPGRPRQGPAPNSAPRPTSEHSPV